MIKPRKMFKNPGLRLCCKRFYNSLLPKFFQNVSMQRKTVIFRSCKTGHFLVWIFSLDQDHFYVT
ncbi:hypothetical protein CsatB_015533 [Cannabis sativa]